MSKAGAAVLAMALVASVALAACGSKAKVGDRIGGRTLTIYASVPLHGASSLGGQAVIRGASLALARVHGRIGRYRIVFKPLDDSTPQRGEWDPGQTTENARIAVQDPTTIGYIGEYNSGASAVSIPVLNRAGIVQISPASTAVGLTSNGPGASPGEPQKYYPTGARTYVRLVPSDAVQAVAQVKLQRGVGCRKTFVLDDGEVDGVDTATSFSLAAHAAGLQVGGVQAFDPGASDYTPLALTIAQTGADCVLISAITESHAVPLARQLAAALPHVRIFGSAGVAESTFADPAQGGIPLSLDPRVLVTVATLGPAASPPSARAFYAAYARRYGAAQPYSIYGYEAMSLLLSAISRGTDGGTRPARRSKVVSEVFATKDRHSVLGIYSIGRDGDTTLRGYGVYRVVDGQLAFWKEIDA